MQSENQVILQNFIYTFVFFIQKMYQPKLTDTLTMFTHNKKLSKKSEINHFL